MYRINNKDGPDVDVGCFHLRRPRDGTERSPRDETQGNPRDGTGRRPRDETPGNPRDGTGRRPRDETPGNPRDGTGRRPRDEIRGNPRKGTARRPRDETRRNPRDGTGGRPRDGTLRNPRGTVIPVRGSPEVRNYFHLVKGPPKELRNRGKPSTMLRRSGRGKPAILDRYGRGMPCRE